MEFLILTFLIVFCLMNKYMVQWIGKRLVDDKGALINSINNICIVIGPILNINT